MFMFKRKRVEMVSAEDALVGRPEPVGMPDRHFLNGLSLDSPVPEGFEVAMFGMGCFWGVERMFWKMPGVWLTMVGYAGGFTPNPTYKEVCSGLTGHNEVVRLIFDPAKVSYGELLRVFWEGHDPTQGMRQGNDTGTQYRSGIYWYSEAQRSVAEMTKAEFGRRLTGAGFGSVTTEIVKAPEFHFAEDYHQQYLAKNPGGYCGLGGTGVTCPVGEGAGSERVSAGA